MMCITLMNALLIINVISYVSYESFVSCSNDVDCFYGRCVDQWCECYEGWGLVRGKGCYELLCDEVSVNGRCYHYEDQRTLTWFTASEKCQEVGFDLVSINSEDEENDLLKEFDYNQTWLLGRAVYTGSDWQIKGNHSYKSIDDDFDGYDVPMLCLGARQDSLKYQVCSQYYSTGLLCERPIIFTDDNCYDSSDCQPGYICFGWHCEPHETVMELTCSFNLATADMMTTSVMESTEYFTTVPQMITSNSTMFTFNSTMFTSNSTLFTNWTNTTTLHYTQTQTIATTITSRPMDDDQEAVQSDCYINGHPETLFSEIDGIVVDDGISNRAVHFGGDGNFSSTVIYDMPCAFLPQKCVNGLTVSLWIKPTFTELQDDSISYIMSSGAPSRTGFAIYRQNKDIYMTVNTEDQMWETVISHTTPDLMSDVWSSIAFTWAPPNTLADVTSVEPVTLPQNTTQPPTTPIGTTQQATQAPSGGFVLSAFLDGELINQSSITKSISVRESVRMLVIGGYYDTDSQEFNYSMSGLFDELAIADENDRTGIDLLREVDLDACKTMNDCDNGTCFTSYGNRECRCKPGFEGDTCDSDIRECDSSPCLNGTCVEGLNRFTCDCIENWDGVLCDKNLCPSVNYDEDVKDLTFYNTVCNKTDTEFFNPVYAVAQHYPRLSELFLSEDDLEDVVESQELSRGGACTSHPVLGSSEAFFKPPNITEACIDSPFSCDNGFAVSLWVKIERSNWTTANTTIFGVVLHTKKDQEGLIIRFNKKKKLAVKVFGDSSTSNRRTLTDQFIFVEGIWFNIGVSWRKDIGTSIYINGNLQQTVVYDLNSDNTGDGNSELTIGGSSNLRSLSLMTVSDIVIWNRYLFEFESYRFVGVTASEWLYLSTSKYYIPTDKFIWRDHAAILNMTSGTSQLLTMHFPSTVDLSTTTGRDVKGSALELKGSTDQETIFSDELPNTCLSDPSLCRDGMTVSIWTKIYKPQNDKYAFIFSSGEQASRGMSMYIRMRQRLGAAVTDGDTRWIIDLSFIPDPTVWVHLAISWHKDIGLYLYINGKLRGVDNIGYRKIRADDLHFRLTIGRRNDVNCMQSHIIFEDFAFFEKFVAPYEAMESFGFPDTRNYEEPKLFYNARTFIGTGLDLIPADIEYNEQETLGPSGNGISVLSCESGTNEYLHLNRSEIILGFPFNSNTTCFSYPRLCEEGFSISVWVTVETNVAVLQSSGIKMSIEDDTLVCTVSGNDVKEARTNISWLNSGEWVNFAMTWSELNSLDIYINGILADSSKKTLPNTISSYDAIGNKTDLGLNIFNLAFWERFTYSRNTAKFLGVTESQLTCVTEATYCWLFESALSLVHPYTVSTNGTRYVMDRTEEGRAIATDGVTGWVSLGNSDACPSDPSLCESGFALSLWLKFVDADKIGHVLSVGGKNTTKGVWIQQCPGSYFAEVADGTHVWTVDIPAENTTYNEWFRFGLTWSAGNGLSISINGKAISTQEPFSADGRSTEFSGEMVLGKVSGLDESYVQAEYDDIELYISRDVKDLPDVESLSGTDESVKYDTADEYYVIETEETSNETQLDDVLHYITDQEHKEFSYIDMGDYADLCLSTLERCSSAGVTMSVWFLPATNTFTNAETNSEGRGYIISSGAQNNESTGFAVWYNGAAITAIAKKQMFQWEAATSFPFVENTWSNVGFSWSEQSGLALFIDGQLMSSDAMGNISKPCLTDVHTRLILGRRNDADDGYLNAMFRDPAIWYYDIADEDQDASSILLGEDPEAIVITDNHDELDALSSFIGQECSIHHDADCARDLNELLSIINDEEEVTPELVLSSKIRLQTLLEEQQNLTVDDLSTTLQIFYFLVNSPITEDVINETSASTELQDYLTIVSQTLEEQNQPEWIALQKLKPGSSSLIKDLDYYTMKMSTHIRGDEGHDYILLTSPEIAVEIRSFPIESFENDGYVYPRFNENSSTDTNSSQFWQRNTNSFKLPGNFFTFTKQGQVASIVFTLYQSLETVFPNVTSDKFYETEEQKSVLNSKIMSISVNPPLRMNLYHPFTLVMEHLMTPQKINNETTFVPVCAFWNYDLRKPGVNNSDGAWDKDGCDVKESNENYTTCDCYHFTSFAIFMEPKRTISNDDEVRITWILMICSAVSLIPLTVLIAYYLITSRLKTVLYNVNLNLCWAVFFNSVGLIVSGILHDNKTACGFVGVYLHTTFLSVVNWLLVGAIHIYFKFQENDRNEKNDSNQVNCFSEKFSLYLVAGWGIPMMISATTFAVTRDIGYAKQARGLCWLSDQDSIPLAFTIPLVVASLIILLVVFAVYRNMTDDLRRIDFSTSYRSGTKGSFILTIYCCMTWVFGLMGLYGDDKIWADYLFSVFISFLGVAIFCIQGFLNKEVNAILCWLDPDVELTEIQKIDIKPDPAEQFRPKCVYHP